MVLKDWIKSKPYWLKGGIIGTISSLLIEIVLIITDTSPSFLPGSIILIGLLGLPWSFFMFYIGAYFLILIAPLLNGFIIGVFVGWIYKKIKSKNKKKSL